MNFSSLICYTDQSREPPGAPDPVSLGWAVVGAARHARGGRRARRGVGLLGATYVRVYTQVCRKTVPCSLPTRRLGGHELVTTDSHVDVVRSHSMSVDLISHFTPQKIFNKSKKKEYNDRRALSRSLTPSPPQETGPEVRGSLKKLQFAHCFHPLVFTSSRTTWCHFQFLKSPTSGSSTR